MRPERQYERLCALIADTDPLLVEAVHDVDLALLEWSLSLSPWERLEAKSLRFLSAFRRVAPDTR
jgi:hypothetical protein